MTASSPEELEILLEDALILHDAAAVAALFEDRGILVTVPGSVVGPAQVANALEEHTFVASPHSATLVGDIAVVVGDHHTVNISCRGTDRRWRLVVAIVMPGS
ncbi:MAG: hypothetical protein QOI54_261 [Actinomycetota bacterium]|jgi:hypothetical protein|nr:hypothetical protein [Actinomycetota bacterium]